MLVAAALGFWLFERSRPPAPTAFGWPAQIVTIAGSGTKGYRDGQGNAARFSDPFGLAVDDAGNLYVADGGDTNRIRKIAPDGQAVTLPGRFDTPSGVAIDTAGNIIVADTGANLIRMISPQGAVSTVAGDGIAGFRDGPGRQARFNGPLGVAVDAKGTIFVADSYNDRIRTIDPNGKVTTLAGNGAPGFRDGLRGGAAFDTPGALVLDGNGGLLVADTGNDAIRQIDAAGYVGTRALSMASDRDGLLREPVGLARTWDGYLYIASYRRGRILQLAPSGELRVLVGSKAATPGNERLQLATPSGLAIGPTGTLFVADPSRYAVVQLKPRHGSPEAPRHAPIAPPVLLRARSVPWPVAPQDSWHEVVGGLGEVRGNYQGEDRDHLHAGLDIRGGVGQAVLAIADEKVADPIPNGSIDRLSESLRIDDLTYVHMRVGRTANGDALDPKRFQLIRDAQGNLASVRVKRGTRFRVGDRLGTINSMAHVHLELGPPRGKVNAMALPFVGLTDSVAPHIESIRLIDGRGHALEERQDGRLVVPATAGPLAIVVDAWDQLDGNGPHRRLGLYKAGFQLLHDNGAPLKGFERPLINLLFDRMPLDPDAAKFAYAPSSGISVYSGQPTRFLYVVTNRVRDGRAEAGALSPADLKPGDYLIRVLAADFTGNIATASRDLPIRVR